MEEEKGEVSKAAHETRFDLLHGPLALLCVALFLATLTGGTVSVDAFALQPGYTPLMKAIFGGSELPILSHFVPTLLICTAAAWVLASRRVLQVPLPYMSILWIAFFGLVCASVVFSGFPFVSMPAALEWATYGIAAFATIAITGRRSGPFAALTALVLGTVILALIGILEHRTASDPNWRIFGTWQNPNALAGMLLIGFFISLGLMAASKRFAAAIFGLSAVMIGYALALTQSKGAFVAAAVGLVALLAVMIAWIRGVQNLGRILGAVGVCLVAVIGLLFLMRLRPSDSIGIQAPLARVTEAASSQEQSAGFRILLWKSAAELIKKKPLGWGIGAYRFESARPGLTTQTHLAHNSFLQLGAEAGALSVILLFAVAGVWIGYFFKGARRQSDLGTICLRAGIFSAVSAAAAHNLIDSDLYFFGTGLVFFVLLALGLQLSSDGVTPESVQPAPRWSAFGTCVAVSLTMFYFGAIEATKSHLRYQVDRGEVEEARAGADALKVWASSDGEALYLAAMTPDGGGLDTLRLAAVRAPSTRILRALARQQHASGDSSKAIQSLLRALERDPNNLLALQALMNIWHETGRPEEAANVARRMLQVEKTPVYQTRALPELVPTETFYARMYLAGQTENPSEKIVLLLPALDGLTEYAAKTVPNIVTAVKAGMPGFAGESAERAATHLRLGKEIAEELSRAYREIGDEASVSAVEGKAESLDEALASLG